MKYAMIPLIILSVIIWLVVRAVWEEQRKQKNLEQQLYELWGKLPIGYENEKKQSAKRSMSYRTIVGERFLIDDITWNELDMDCVFARLNYTMSQTGAEYLYAALHCPAEQPTEAAKWERSVAYFMSHTKQRVEIQLLLAKIGKHYHKSFYDCMEEIKHAKKRSLWKEYVSNAFYFAAVFTAMYDVGLGLCILIAVVMYQIVTYFRERARILPWLQCVAGILRMAECMDRLCHTLDEELQSITEQSLHVSVCDCAETLRGLKRHSFWVLQCGRENSSPISMLGDYARMLFHMDIIQFAHLEKRLSLQAAEIEKAATLIGFLDSSISIALYRASLPVWCIPFLQEGKADFSIKEGYHPLLKKPVANSVSVSSDKGVLLTGSNASGKSTFLKTVAINLLLAQTIHTALAESFLAPVCRIYTSMGAKDSIEKGESSYMAEILSLKRIMDAEEKSTLPIACFVDEILRGTNTIERIAASTQILKYLRKKKIYCFAATHDRELTWIVKKDYDNYHFTETIKEGDILFSYKLLPGSADTSNAIRLLEMTGYASEITRAAEKQAEIFLKERIWK